MHPTAPALHHFEPAKPQILSSVVLKTRIRFTSARTIEPYIPERVVPGPLHLDVPYVPSGQPTFLRDLAEPDVARVVTSVDTES